jgi:hypothetical protein
VASLSCPFSLLHGSDEEETGLMLSGISLYNSTVIFVVTLHMKSSVEGGVDEGVSVVVLEDFEELIGLSMIVSDDQFVSVVLESEALVGVDSTDDFVGDFWVGSEEELLRSLHF